MVKQVIVVNMAVPMGIGQLAAQATHAQTAVLLDMGDQPDRDCFQMSNLKGDMIHWMKKSFTTIVAKEWGVEALQALKDKADEADLPTSMITDYGHVTAIAIGPADAAKIDVITRHLPLL